MNKVYDDTKEREDVMLAKVYEANEKARFTYELGRLVNNFSDEIKKFNFNDSSELVIITYNNGHTAEVNVAGDSLVAIMYDVGKYLCEH